MSDDDVQFKINKNYADRYNRWRRNEEYQKLKDKYGEDVLDSSSEEEDDNAEEITPQFEKNFLRALSSVRSEDPRIYNQEISFFKDEETSKVQDGEEKEAKVQKKPMFLKDYERKIIMEKGGKFSDDEDEDGFRMQERPSSPTYVEEQEQIRSSFKDALKEDIEDESFLKTKKKTKKEKEQEEAEYIQWLKGERQEISDEEQAKEAQDVVPLRQYWTDPDLEVGEKFLRDFILNKAYIPTGDEPEDMSDIDLSEDDRDLDAQDNFERKFNFRYEEPDSEFVKTFPRNVAGSKRRKDTSRAQKRQEVKIRKNEEKKKMQEELKQMKNLKKQEILEQLEKLKRVTGNTKVGFDENDLGGDFDANQHDELMKKVFNEEYDGLDEDRSKPVFEDEEFAEENWDEWTGQEEDGYQPHCDDADFIMDADYDPTAPKKEKRKKKDKGKNKDKKNKAAQNKNLPINGLEGRQRGKHVSQFAEALHNEKPIFDPEDETFENYFDEYYKLDYEDIIGDLPCRFKYRQVVANNFGLTAEETLFAEEKELNRWASLKKTCQYRTRNEELSDLSSFKEKGLNIYKKKQVFKSLHEKDEDSESDDTNTIGTRVGETPSDKGKKPGADTDVGEQRSNITNSKDKIQHNDNSFVATDMTVNGSISSEDATSKMRKKKQIKKKISEQEGDDSIVTAIEEENHKSVSVTEKKKHMRQDHMEKDVGKSLSKKETMAKTKTKKRKLPESGDINEYIGGESERKHVNLGDGEKEVEKKQRERSDIVARVSQKGTSNNFRSRDGKVKVVGSKDEKELESSRSRKQKLMEALRRKKKMKKKKQISDTRLKAYGIRPKDYKYRLKQQRIKQKNQKR